MSDRADRRRRSNIRQYSAEDQALDQISKEADQRLQAKRAARAEARQIRLKEIEKQQKEAEERQDRLHGLTSEHVKTRQLSGSRRNSTDSTESMESNRDRDRDLKAENRDLEEKYKQAMMTSATLDNEKQTLVFQLELLKDQIEEMEESHTELQREHRDRCRELEMKKRAYTELDAEVKILKEHMVLKDKLIEESGFVIMSTEDGEYTLEKNPSMSNGPVPTGGSVLLSTESIAMLKEAGEGSLGTATQHHLRSSPVHETKPRDGKSASTESESPESQVTDVVLGNEANVSEKDPDSENSEKKGSEQGSFQGDSGSVVAPEKELVEESLLETDSSRGQSVVVPDVVDGTECVDGDKDKENDFDTSDSHQVVEARVLGLSELEANEEQIDSNRGTEQDIVDSEVKDKLEIDEIESKGEIETPVCLPALELNLIKDSPDGIPRDDSGIFSPDDVGASHVGFSSDKFDVKIIEPDTDEEGDEFFDAISTPSPFVNKADTKYEFKDAGEDPKDDDKVDPNKNGQEVKVPEAEDQQSIDQGVEVEGEEIVQEKSKSLETDAEKLPVCGEARVQEKDSDKEEAMDAKDQEGREEAGELELEATTHDEQGAITAESNNTEVNGASTEDDQVSKNVNSENNTPEISSEIEPVGIHLECVEGEKTRQDSENKAECSDAGDTVNRTEEGSTSQEGDSADASISETDELMPKVTSSDSPSSDNVEQDLENKDQSQKEVDKDKVTLEDAKDDQEGADDEFKDAESVKIGKEKIESATTCQESNEHGTDQVPSDEGQRSEMTENSGKTDKIEDIQDSADSDEMHGSSVDREGDNEIETKIIVTEGDKDDIARVDSDEDVTKQKEDKEADDSQRTKDTDGESCSSSVDGIVEEKHETAAPESDADGAGGESESGKGLGEEDNAEAKDIEDVRIEGSSVDVVVKDETESSENVNKTLENSEKEEGKVVEAIVSDIVREEQNQKDNSGKTEESFGAEDVPTTDKRSEERFDAEDVPTTDKRSEECFDAEDVPTTDKRSKDEDLKSKVMVEGVTEQEDHDIVDESADDTNKEINSLKADTPSKDTDAKDTDVVKDETDKEKNHVETDEPQQYQETESKSTVEKTEKESTLDSGKSNEDNEKEAKETPCADAVRDISDSKVEAVEKESIPDNEQSEVKEKPCDSVVTDESKMENVDVKEGTDKKPTSVEELEGKDSPEKDKEKSVRRSEDSGDSDDDVFVHDVVSQQEEAKKVDDDSPIPDSPMATPEKKSGSQLKSEGELSEDDLLDDAYSFDDIDEVLEEGEEQKVDGDKKPEPKAEIQRQISDTPKIVIDEADTKAEDKEENRSIDSSTKASSSDSVSTGSGKDGIDPASDDAMSTGSGAEGLPMHPPPSPKEGKKGKKFGKFFKNIFK